MTREEAIENIKKALPLSDTLAESFYTLHPELRESEDEKIRREIVDFLTDGIWNTTTIDKVKQTQRYAKWIAYLERQKIFSEKGEGVYGYKDGKICFLGKWLDNSMYPCDAPVGRDIDGNLVYMEDLEGEKQEEPHYTKRNALFDKCVENNDPAIMKEVSDNVDKMLEKEQKPVNVDYISGIRKVLLGIENNAKNINGLTGNQWVAIRAAHRLLGEYVEKEQKPAEWSEDWREEDIQTRFAFYTYKDDPSVLYLSNVFVEEASRNHGFGTRILRAAEKVAETIGAITISLKVKQDSPANAWYRKNGYGYVAFEDGYDWLEKNLEYMKPKEPEWSEEDEKMRIHCIDIFDKILKSSYIYAYTRDCKDWCENRVKSFRPQPRWKPSEEQMNALNSLNLCGEVTYIGQQEELISLYHDLKKL